MSEFCVFIHNHVTTTYSLTSSYKVGSLVLIRSLLQNITSGATVFALESAKVVPD